MRRAAILTLFGLLIAGSGIGQTDTGNTSNNPQQQETTTQNPTTPSTAIAPISPGAEVHATLDTPLSTRTSRPGDRFTASITDPVSASDGTVVIPYGSRMEGEVAEAEEGKTAAAFRGKGKLNLRFRDIVLPNGQTLPVNATLISVNDTGRNLKKAIAEEPESKGITRNTDRNAGMSAAGPVFGGPLKGLAIGTLAGGGFVLSTKGKEVNLPAQTGMVIRLDQAVSSNASR
ncbi:MAG TPA: hypothetical protein VFB79_09870 [Candidatus Angelobacter sp.]|nr:hypothetical protein [Candidatus Angelobacter sp.]